MKGKRCIKQLLVLMLSVVLLMSDCMSVSAASLTAYPDDQTVAEEVQEIVEDEVVDEDSSIEEEGTEEDEEIVSDEDVTEDEEIVTDEDSDDEQDEDSEITDEEEISEEEISDEEIIDEISEEVVTEEVAEIADSELVGGFFPGMGETYTPSDYQNEMKNDFNAHASSYDSVVEGYDYVANQIIVEADDEAQAEEFATAFNGTLKEFNYGLALIELNASDAYPKATVMDAITIAAKSDSALPAAWPNGINYKFTDESVDEYTDEEIEDDEYIDEYIDEDIEDEEIIDIDDSDSDVLYDEDGNIVEDGLDYVFKSGDDPMLNVQNSTYQWHHNQVGSYYAWQAGYTGSGITVGIIDGGINPNHEEFAGRGIVAKYSNDSNAAVSDDHGNNVAGIVAASANGKGGRGIAYNAKVIGYDVFGYSSGASDYYIYNALQMAVNDGCNVVNMSLGGPVYNGAAQTMITNAAKAGVVIVIAAGNDATSGICYPAGYNNHITVAAVDKNNKRARFSNFGKINFSAPGVDMTGPSNGDNSSYVTMNGTSQATPVITGMIAVLMSAGKIKTNAGIKNLASAKSVLAKGANKSGLGKGTPHFGKILGVGTDTSVSKPSTNMKSGTYKAKTLSVKVELKGRDCDIYYYTGKGKLSYNAGVTNATKISNGGTVNLTGARSIKLQVIAVDKVTKQKSATATYKYTLKPLVEGITISPKNGVPAVKYGGKIQLVSSVTPSYAGNKAVTWSVKDNTPGISVSKSGLVSVSSKATVGSFVIYATAKDSGHKVGSITLYCGSTPNPVTTFKFASKNKSVYLNETVEVGFTAKLKDGSVAPNGYYDVSYDSTAVAVSIDSANSVLKITGRKVGKTTVKLLTNDGTCKSISIPVTVKAYVSSIGTISVGDSNTVVAGKTVKATTTVNPENASNKKIEWSIVGTPAGYVGGVSVEKKTGKVVTKSKAVPGTYTIQATAADRKKVSRTAVFTIISAEQKITGFDVSTSSLTIYRVSNTYKSTPRTATFTFAVKGNTSSTKYKVYTDSKNFTVGVSGKTIAVTANGNGVGKGTVVIESTDGTNIKKKVNVEIVNPASALRLSHPSGRTNVLALGKTMKLSATFETAYGSISNASKKLTWSSSNASAVSVSSNGTLKALKDESYSTITATNPDGVKASYTVYTGGSCTGLRAEYDFGFGFEQWGPGMAMYKGKAAAMRAFAVNRKGSIGNLSYSKASIASIKVNKEGLAIINNYIYDEGWVFMAVANKAGTYTITLTPQDGNKGKATFKVKVY